MKIDDIAVKMFYLFRDNDDITSTDITNSIFKPKTREELLKKNNLIIGRLKTWIKKGIIVNGTSKDRIAHYNLNSDNIKIGRLLLDVGDGDVDELGEYLVIDVNGMNRMIIPLDE